MTTQINIGGSSNDPFYRYTMPSVVVGNKNGKTEIVNLTVIARDLERPETFLRGAFKTMFNTAVTEKHGKTVLQGTFTQKQIQDCLSVIVDRYVLCGTCGNPETELAKSGTMSCRSCGSKTKVEIPLAWKKYLSVTGEKSS